MKKDFMFFFFVSLAVVLAVFFRTYNYIDRVNIHSDNAWELQVVRYAFDNLRIPEVGPFSSAGPFFYGPWYFWIFMVMTVVPLGFLTHWYLMTILSFVFIYLVFWIGKEVGGKWVGAISALYAAVSTAAVDNSFSIWSPALIPFLVALSLVFLIRFSKKRKFLDLFLLSFNVSLSITIHFQSVLISPILIAAVILVFLQKPNKSHLVKSLLLVIIGFVIPFLPLIWWDIRHNWYDSTSLAVYLLVDQYKIWVPNRWLTYAGSYWPQTWAEIIGGSKYVGGFVIGLVAFFCVLRFKKFKEYTTFYLVALTFLFEVILFRYYRGERFYYYSLFAQPAVLVLTAFVTYELFKVRRLAGITLGTILTLLTFNKSLVNLKDVEIPLSHIQAAKIEIYNTYPDKKFDVYGCIFNGTRVSHPTAVSMYMDGRNTQDGVKIGMCENPDGSVGWHELTEEEYTGEKAPFFNTSTEHVYKGMQEWWIEKPPGKGNLWKFLGENL